MDRRYIKLIVILVLLALVIWIDIPNSGPLKIGSFERTLEPVLGLDLRGGLQVLLRPQQGLDYDAQNLEDAAKILESRSNGLGVSEVTFQLAGNEYILGEFPGLTDTEGVIKVLKQTGLLELVDTGSTYLEPGTVVVTDYGQATTGESTPTEVPSAAETPAENATPAPEQVVYHTVITGADLDSVNVTTAQLQGFAVSFELKPEGAAVFAEHTKNNVGKYLAIVLDKKVISCPSINSAIPDGHGEISGGFTSATAQNLAITLRYGSLPIALDIVESRVIGPTLGQDSLDKSIRAGIIGFSIVFLFMMIYYRVPGFAAVLAIIFYALFTFALFKLLPVTLTLPSIAGFLLSTGSALDANILYFERMKEELRSGRNIHQALELAWKRAWPSIRDSNIAALITSAILFWFGSAFGASVVKGFALTLAIGVVVSVFTAFFVTRTLLSLISEWIKPTDRERWYGA